MGYNGSLRRSAEKKDVVRGYRRLAEQGDAFAQYNLGNCYFDGDGVEQDDEEAVKWFRKSAEQGNAMGQYRLGDCYCMGIGVEQDENEAVKWFRKSADQGNAGAQYSLGCCYFYGEGVEQDENEAVKLFLKSAEQENVEAQDILGDCYLNGDGVAKDESEAVKWYRRAAEQDNPDSQYKLGECCYKGVGVAKNFEEAVEWFLRAADFDNSNARYKLGVCCYNGFGVAKNFEKAVEWFRKSAESESGNAGAEYMLGNCYYNGEGVDKSLERAVEWFRKSADSGNGDAEYKLGSCYYNGEGVARNAEEALKWWSRAAEKGSAVTQYELGRRCYYGDGLPKDYDKAAKWYRRAADSGHADAQYMLAGCYVNGTGVARDYDEALKWYRRSAESGNAKADFRLSNDQSNYMGDCYYYGIGVAKNLGSTLEWYRRAAEHGDALAQFKLGNCYYEGNGVERDYVEAVKWLKGPAESGNVAAQFKLGYCYYNGNGVERDYVEAVKWLKGPAESGNVEAQLKLGDCYYKGDGVKKDYNEAVKWFKNPAESGNVEAQFKLGECYYKGDGVKIEVGDFVEFGRYPQESGNESQPVEWQVLSKENGHMLVISRYGLDAKRFDGSSNDWGDSEIRKWLNGEFYNGSFAAEEKARIKSFNQDNVFLLSWKEAEKYFADDDARKCKPTSYAKAKGAWIDDNGCGYWWLRSPNPNYSNYVSLVDHDGDVSGNYFSNCSGCLRPALWIKDNGVEQDCKEAVKWLKNSAESGNADAQCMLGNCYFSGDGVKKDFNEALKWWGRSAVLGNAEAKEKMERNGNPFRNAEVGDFVKFGRYPQESGNEFQPVEWQVLSKENGQTLVISRYGLDAKRFGSSNNWGNSEIRKWLNGEFYNGSFAAEEKARIKSFNQDNVFLLNLDEAVMYFANSDARKCKSTSYAKAKGARTGNNGCGYWWLRSPYPSRSNNVYVVSDNGGVDYYHLSVDDINGSVRPALWIKGDGVDCKWLKGPAESGNADAQCMLGNCYFSGDGVKKDFNEALKWWGRSAALGNSEAKENMERSGNPFWGAKVGDFVKFGRYPQESGNESQPVEWQVLSKENGQMLVISRYVLDARRFDVSSNDWGNSEIRKWLNGKFYNGSFAAEEKAFIESFNQDNVFLLSREEAENYFANSDARKCKPTSYAKANGLVGDNGCGFWWLRSPYPNNSSRVYYVNFYGEFFDNIYYGVKADYGSVRPALWINLKS